MPNSNEVKDRINAGSPVDGSSKGGNDAGAAPQHGGAQGGDVDTAGRDKSFAQAPCAVQDGGSAGSDATASPEEVARLRHEVDTLKRKADENWDLFLRSRADLDNYRKRTERDIAMMVRMGKKDLLLRLLDIADNFQRALGASNTDPETLRSGLDMLKRQLDAVLEGEGVRAIPAVGEKFNPGIHEAIATWTSPDVKEDTVTDEIQKGYTYQGDVLRVARVRVAQPPAGDQGPVPQTEGDKKPAETE